MKRTYLTLTGIMALLLSLSVPQAQAQAGHDAEVDHPDVVIHVEGMACSMCARSMKNAVGKVEGVEKVEVLLEEQKVLVTLKDGQNVSEETLKEAVTGAGYVFHKAVFAEKESSDA